MVMSKNSQYPRLDDKPELPTEAPGFTVPGRTAVEGRVYRLQEYTGEGVTVVAFVPAESIREARFLAWLTLTDGVDALVVSNHQSSALNRAETPMELSVPVLSDADGSVASAYGLDYDRMTGERILLIDSTNRIRRVWTDGIDPADIHHAAKQHLDQSVESLLEAGNETDDN